MQVENSSNEPLESRESQQPEQLVQARLLEDLFHQAPTIVFGTILLATINLVYYGPRLPAWFLFGWLFLMVLSTSLRLRALQQHKKSPSSHADGSALKSIILASALLGLGWGFLASGTAYLVTAEQGVVAIITAAGVVGSAAATSSASPVVFRVLAFLALLPLTLIFLISGNVTLQFVALLTLCYITILVRASTRIHETLRQSIAASLRNDTLVETLKRQSRTDPLTGLLNRRALNQGIDQVWQQHLHDGGSMGVVICDIDYFKQYNDSLGHLAGDDCLTEVANALMESTRSIDLVTARYGGEEFAILIPQCDAAKLKAIAERLRGAVAAKRIAHPDSQINEFVTISVGASQIRPRSDLALHELIKFADEALYTAKSAGRNRVHLHAA